MGVEESWTPDRGKRWRRDYGEGYAIDESLDSADGAGGSGATGGDGAPRSSPPHPSRPDEPSSFWPVALYVPNLLGYARIFLSFLGLRHALRRHPDRALNAWVAAAILDLFDGLAARRLEQCSRFGTLLDIAADNVLRTTVWVAAMVEAARLQSDGKDECIMLGVAIVCLEWITMFCSQEGNQMHWKEANSNQGSVRRRNAPPLLIRAVFHNNFRSPLGAFAIFGLFVAPLGTYVWLADRSAKSSWPWLVLSDEGASRLIWAAYAGRLLSASVELWLCFDYLRTVIAKDARPRARRKEEKLN